MSKTYDEKEAYVAELRPIDDVFFELLAEDIAFCQEILRVILEDRELTVMDVVVQSALRNIYGRSVRLDALCTLGDGTKCNVDYSDFRVIPINHVYSIFWGCLQRFIGINFNTPVLVSL